MNKLDEFVVGFAGLTIGFCFPEPITVPDGLSAFLCECAEVSEKVGAKLDAEYEIELLTKPLSLPDCPLASYNGMWVYRQGQGWLRVYTPLVASDGCQVACLTLDSGKNKLYYPASKWSFYAGELRFLHLIGIEELLLNHTAFLLHSSVVMINGHMVLFSGPSGAGKSTQASLWERYLGAEVINGDRCVIRKVEDRFWGSGSPWCGTSAIYRREMAPIKGIFVLRQSTANFVSRMKAEAFAKLYQQCIVNEWDSAFVIGLTELLAELLEQIPVYELNCRPDEEAVRLAYHTLFEGGI